MHISQNTAFELVSRRLRRAGAAFAIGIALVTQGGAYAAGQQSSGPSVKSNAVALEYQPAAKALVKATAKALFVSADEGLSWAERALPSPLKGKAVNIAASARDAGLLFISAPGAGVLRSRDNGKNWTPVNKGLPGLQVTALTTHSEQGETVYAYVAGKGIFRSQDAGAQWRLMDRGPRQGISAFVHSSMPGSMETGWLFAATADGVWRSMDCFCGWHRAGETKGSFDAVTYDPAQPERVYAAGRSGVIISTDGGEQWSAITAPPVKAAALVATPAGVLYAAGKDRIYRSKDHGTTWERVDA